MLVSKVIKKLEATKGFKCNHICATCVCEKANKSVLNQIEVYNELHKQGAIPDEKYAKEAYILEKESKALVSCCNRLYEEFSSMIDEKVNDYCIANDKKLNFDEMSDKVYEDVYNSIEQSFIAEYTGDYRYTR